MTPSGTLVVVQARVGSTRFPGKVLAELAGMPMLAFMLRRLAAGGIVPVVATSDQAGDDAVADLARDEGAAVVRGPEDDVLARIALAVGPSEALDVVRLTADCPLSDPAVVQAMVALHRELGADYTSNTLLRTYPDGLDVEVVGRAAVLAADREARDADEREHVTPFIYRRPRRFRLGAGYSPRQMGHWRWTVDTPDDLERVRALVGATPTPLEAGWASFASPGGPGTPDASAARLDPMLPGGWAPREDWRPLFGRGGSEPDEHRWWGAALRGGGRWCNGSGEPFALAWTLTAEGTTGGWLAAELDGDASRWWGAASPAAAGAVVGLVGALGHGDVGLALPAVLRGAGAPFASPVAG
ncbi:MAG TPA: glycosyltransferase family protein [Acidimicrobiales bacterium]|nr:glycosyltransferase family protein [Acidimicrobiales bacterium]